MLGVGYEGQAGRQRDDTPTIDWVLEKARAAVHRYFLIYMLVTDSKLVVPEKVSAANGALSPHKKVAMTVVLHSCCCLPPSAMLWP